MKPKNPPTKNKLLETATRYLSYRPRSEQEVRLHLEKKTEDINLVDETIQDLQNLGVLDDQAFAEWLISSRLRHKRKGTRAISMELRRFGIAREVSNQELQKIDEKDWVASACAYLQKKEYKLAKLEPIKAKQKAYQWLSARGFTSNQVRRAIDAYLEEQ